MADNPEKRGVDAWFVNVNQPHEYRYFFNTIKKQFEKKSDAEIGAAIKACCDSIAPSEGRTKLTACVTKRLGG